jgi:iron complex transport system ATP-binding protein
VSATSAAPNARTSTTNALRAVDIALGTRLHATSLTFTSGSLTAIVGENGAGKSTLLDILAGVHAPAAGSIHLGDDDVRALPPRTRAQRIASLGQKNVDLDDVTAAERIAHGLVPRRGPHALVDDTALQRITAVADELGVAAFLDRPLATLSTGERRRVEVARALVDDAVPCFLLDEPHAGVDVRHQSLVSAALAARAKRGAIVVVSVHDLGVAGVADRVIGMREGRVVVDTAALDANAIEAIYGVSGAVVVRDGRALGVLLPR